jgi:hypothetical protein
MTIALLVLTELVVATSDVGTECSLVAASRDGRYAVYWSRDINEGGSAALVDLSDEKAPLQGVNLGDDSGTPGVADPGRGDRLKPG